MTEERSHAIDYSIPLARDSFTLIAPVMGGKEAQFWVYTDILRLETWLGFFAMIVVTILSLRMLFRCNAIKGGGNYAILNSAELTFMLVLQRSYENDMKSNTSKIAYVTIGFSAYIMFSLYTADLTARKDCRTNIKKTTLRSLIISQMYQMLRYDP
jgi:hypothetical protein